jgi:ubiquinone/menaquinone biosynthesis C-methylase UbiE
LANKTEKGKPLTINYNHLAKEYAQNRKVDPCVLAGLLRTARIQANSQVLELGCGTGNYSMALHEMNGCRIFGIDRSLGMLSIAKNHSTDNYFSSSLAEALCLPGNFFDLAFSVDVIHHISDRGAYFAEAWRVLKPGGACCTVTDSEEIIRKRKIMQYFPEGIDIEIQRYPAIQELVDRMAHQGFHNIRQDTVEFSYEITDLQPFRERAFSILHLISENGFRNGLRRMEADLVKGPIPITTRYVLLWGDKGF